MSGEDVRILAYRSVQLCLEVTAGRRPPAALDHVATADAARWLRDNAIGRRPPPRIRRVAIWPSEDCIDVTALVAGDRQPLTVVTLRLRAIGLHWQITAVEHLRHGQHFQHTLSELPPLKPEPGNSRADRDAHAMLREVVTAAEQRARTPTTWADRKRYLAVARRWREYADRITSHEPSSDQAASYIVAMLGDPPRSGPALAAWNLAAALITDYRWTWNITDPQLALGTPPLADAEHARQRTHRDDTIASIRTLLARHRANDLSQSPSTLEPPGP
jgi:hypothetical protein